MTTTTNLEAGRAADALIAEQVMGFKRWRQAKMVGDGESEPSDVGGLYVLMTEEAAREYYSPGAFDRGFVREADASTEPFSDFDRFVPRYSTDLACSWMVVRHLNEHAGILNAEIDDTMANLNLVGYLPGSGELSMFATAEADNFPLAVCRLALEAKRAGADLSS